MPAHLNRANILGCFIDMVTMEEALYKVEQLINRKTSSQVITLNAEIVYQAYHNPDLRQIINQADLVTPDGIGIVWGGQKLGYPVKERVTGVDLLEKICTYAVERGWKIYLLGAAPGVAEKAGQNLRDKYPGLKICGVRNGYFEKEEEPGLINDIKAQQPDVLLVGLGAPRQEFWINQHRESMQVPVSIGVGGSFDVIAGIKKRAPRLFIKLNLEWLYRLITEPSRFKRQLALPRFAGLIIRQRWHNLRRR